MKPWDGLDRGTAEQVGLSPAERQMLLDALADARPVRLHQRPRAQGASIVGLVLSLALLAGLIWALWPSSPVAPEVMR